MLSIAIISCSDSDKSVNQKYDGQPFTFGGSYNNLWNPANPFDSIGFHHNAALDFASSNYSTLGTELFLEKVDSLIVAYYNSTFSTNLDFNIIRNNCYENIESIIEADEDSISSIEYLNSIFSSNIANELDQTFSLAVACTSSVQLTNTINSIKTIETNVANHTTYTQAEKNTILTTTAVLKFSLVYWDDAINNPNNPWVEIYQDYHETEDELPNSISAGFAALMDAFAAGYQIYNGNYDPITVGGHAAVATGLSYLGALDIVGGCIISGIAKIGAAIISIFG